MRLLTLAAVILTAGCFDATVSDPGVCTSQNFPAPSNNIPPGIPGTFTFSDPVDFSGAMLGDVANNGSATITQLSVSDTSNGMSWVSHMDLSVQGSDGTVVNVASYDADPNNPAGSSVDFTVQSVDVYKLLSQGQATMVATVTGVTPALTPALTADFCLSLSAHASKSLL